VDQRAAALAEAGDVIIPIDEGHMTADHIHAELGEVVAGLKEARTDKAEITVFKSVGLAIQDVSTATRVYELAKEKGAGATLSLS
jgi:ornithine cyclodeaminase/alanine dehydrogenase-like protein (mu-crystallin family)